MRRKRPTTTRGVAPEREALRVRLPPVTRVPRRDALKGLGALAISGTALAAVGCSTAGSSTNQSPVGSSGVGASGPAKAAGAPSAGSGVTSGHAGSASTASGGTAGSSVAAAGASGQTAGASAAAGTGQVGSAGAAAGGGGSVAAMTTDLSSLACIVTPAMTDGPFFVEEKLDRSNLIMGETDDAITKATPLQLTMGIYKVSGMMCTPVSGVSVDVWQANALGIYSDVASGAIQATDTRGKKFLRGYQTTNEHGMVVFETIYPGWYMSRTIHIHFKIRMPGGSNTSYDFTSQMFFDEAVNKAVLAKAPYTNTPGTRSVFNDDDHIYNGTAMNGQKPAAGKTAPGKMIMPKLTQLATGYSGTLKIGLMI